MPEPSRSSTVMTMGSSREIDADTWRAASVEAYKRAGVAICDGTHAEAVKWQKAARAYARNSYIKDSTAQRQADAR